MSINDNAAKERESRIGLESLDGNIASGKSDICQSTGFNASSSDIFSSGLFSAKDRDWIARSQSALSANTNTSDGDETSISTVSSTSDTEEHRQLIQIVQSQSPSLYSSFCSGYSDSDTYCSTLEDDPSYESPFTSDSEKENYSDDDGHYNLIQPSPCGSLPCDSDADYSSSSDEIQQHDYVHVHIEPEGENVHNKQDENKKEFCVQCHAWPELEDCRDPPRNLYEECYHTRIDPKECAFGSNVHMNSISLSFVDENPIAVAKRKAIESALSSQFYLLIQQFAVNSEKVARILYGISVINIDDLEIATIHALTEIERATVLAITLVRRLRRWPDLFGDVCKVLGDIPSMQEANAKVRQLLYEGCSEDQYSEILAWNIEHQQQQQHEQHEEPTENDHHSPPTSADEDEIIMEDSVSQDTSDPVVTAEVKNCDIAVEDSVSYTSLLSKESGLVATDEETHSDVFTRDSVSQTATEESNPVAADNDCACSRVSAISLHETCLENRSIRSLDALINDEELDINAIDKNGRTPLIVACLCLPSETPNANISKKQRKKIRRILENGADSSIQDYDGNTALHIAALRRDQEVVKLLLDRSYIKSYFNIAVTNKNCRTALHYACYWGDMELVAPILDFDKDAKSGLTGVRDRNGDTGLHITCRGGFKAVVKELLKANANREILNKEGQTAADVAEGKKHNGIAKLLRRKKSRWLFPRKKSVTSDQTDYGMHRSSSCSSIGSDQSDLLLLSEESDIEFEDNVHVEQ